MTTTITWIYCTDSMPKDGVMVLVAYVENNRHFVGIAEHAGPLTLPLNEEACGEGEYDEDGNEWCFPGWYSQNAVSEVEWKLDGIYAWAPLPDAPDARTTYAHVTPTPTPCDHDWGTGPGDPETCVKCGMSFTRHIFTECP